MKGKDIFILIHGLPRRDKARVKKYLAGKPEFLTDLFDRLSNSKRYDQTEFQDYGSSLHSRFDRLSNEIFDAQAHFTESRKVHLLRAQSAFELSQLERVEYFLHQFATGCLNHCDLEGLLTAHSWRLKMERSGYNFSFDESIPDQSVVLESINTLSTLNDIYLQLRELIKVPPSKRKLMVKAQKTRLESISLLQFPKEKFWKYKLESFLCALESDFTAALSLQEKANHLLHLANVSPAEQAKEIQQMAFLYFWSGDMRNAITQVQLIPEIKGLPFRKKEQTVTDLELTFSLDAGDLSHAVKSSEKFSSIKDSFSPQKRVNLSYYSALARFYNGDYREAISWTNLVFQEPSKFRQDYQWALYLIQSLSYWYDGDFDFYDQLKVRAIRAAKKKGIELPVLFLRAFPKRNNLAQFLGKIDALLLKQDESNANHFFDFQVYTSSILFRIHIESLIRERYASKTKSSLG